MPPAASPGALKRDLRQVRHGVHGSGHTGARKFAQNFLAKMRYQNPTAEIFATALPKDERTSTVRLQMEDQTEVRAPGVRIAPRVADYAPPRRASRSTSPARTPRASARKCFARRAWLTRRSRCR